jgi:hypothetical protein
LLLTVALSVAGCGGGGSGGGGKQHTTVDPSSAPVPKEKLASAAARLQRTLPSGDCKALIRLMLHSIERGSKPDAPPTSRECAYMKTEAKRELRGYRVTKVSQFGTSGFTEGTGANAHTGMVVGIVWVLDADGSWKAVYEAIFRPQIGVAPEMLKESAANAVQLVSALRTGNCKELFRLLSVASRFVRGVDGNRERFCRGLPATYGNPSTAFAQIKADDHVTVGILGRTRDFAFYSIKLTNGRYMNLVLSGQLRTTALNELKQHANPSALELLTVRQPR